MNNPDFLRWIADRFINVYGESKNVDFVRRLRELAELLANGERVEWCETHFDTWATVGACRNGVAEDESHRCVKVSRLLVDPPKEEGT